MQRSNCKYCQKELKPNNGRGRPREFCDDKCRRRYHSLAPCEVCGKPAWGKLCLRCSNKNTVLSRKQIAAEFWDQVLELRKQGLLNSEIATKLKRSDLSITSAIYRMRKAGLNVPETTYDPQEWMAKWYRLREARGDIKVRGDINL